MEEKNSQAYISSHTFTFAHGLIRSIADMAADASYVTDNSSYREKPFTSSFGMTAVIHFSGTVEGDYILSLDEATAADMIGMHRPGMPKADLQVMRTEYGEFIKELLNLASARAISSLEPDLGALSYTPPILIFGRIEFPAILSGSIEIKGRKGNILCGFSLNNAQRKISRKIELITDELEKKKFENEEVHEKLGHILEKVPCGIVSLDSQCRILPGCRQTVKPRIYPAQEQDIAGMRLAEVLKLSPEDASGLETWVEMVFGYYGLFEFEKLLRMSENRFNSRNGRTFRMNWIPVPNRRTGQLDYLQLVIEDMTEKRHLEFEIKEKEKLKKQLRNIRKMEIIANLAGGMCHDFNNVLMGIQGNTELCIKYGLEGEKLQDRLNHVLNACNVGKSMVSQLMTVSRGEKTEFRDVAIIPVIKETMAFLRSSIPPAIDIRQTLLPAPAVVKSAPGQIHQILMNLCINAAHAMEETGGVLSVNLDKFNLEKSSLSKQLDLEPGSYVRLTVSDTGCGVEQEVAEKMFDPFFTTKKKGKGSGIGLSVVYTIVKNHKGAVHVYSQPGKGTTFHVFFPESSDQAKPHEEGGMNSIPGGSERILVADDDPIVSYMTREILTELGYRVKTASDPKEVLAMFEPDPRQFDLVITDQVMPSMKGVELAEKMVKIRPDIPVILCSGFTRSLLSEEIKGESIRDFIMKPYSKQQIAQTIRRVLDGGAGRHKNIK